MEWWWLILKDSQGHSKPSKLLHSKVIESKNILKTSQKTVEHQRETFNIIHVNIQLQENLKLLVQEYVSWKEGVQELKEQKGML